MRFWRCKSAKQFIFKTPFFPLDWLFTALCSLSVPLGAYQYSDFCTKSHYISKTTFLTFLNLHVLSGNQKWGGVLYIKDPRLDPFCIPSLCPALFSFFCPINQSGQICFCTALFGSSLSLRIKYTLRDSTKTVGYGWICKYLFCSAQFWYFKSRLIHRECWPIVIFLKLWEQTLVSSKSLLF